VPKLLFVVRDRFVPIPSVQNMRRNRPFCAWVCPKLSAVRHSCGNEAHMQPGCPSDEACERCQEHGHSEPQCPKPRCKASGSSNHQNASSFACPEHRCTKCKGVMDPKGHNKSLEAEVQARPLRKPKGKPHRDYSTVQAIRC
jgi:hypothetical protein